MLSARMRSRWGDNDYYLGPFTYARDGKSYRPLAIVLKSGGDDEDESGCSLRLSGFGHTFIVTLPAIIKPWRRWVDTSHYHWSREGGGYWDVHAKSYGFSCSEGFLQVFLGPQTNDSTSTRSRSWFLPWTQWRFVRRSMYDLDGAHFWTEPPQAKLGEGNWQERHDARKEAEERCPTASFAFLDFDGERLTATTRIEEMEWKFGEGWFKWLSFFRKPMIKRSLDIQFSGETGKRKGSWKGGTVGHSINMLVGEKPETAFRRYCAEHDMAFQGSVSTEEGSGASAE